MVPFPKIAFSDMKIKIFRISKKRSHISSFALCLGRNLPIPFIKIMNKTKIEKTWIALRVLELLGIQSARRETEEGTSPLTLLKGLSPCRGSRALGLADLVSCPKNNIEKFNVETGDRTVGAAKIGGKWSFRPPIPLPPQRNTGPFDNVL
jgi:hypothetical protein